MQYTMELVDESRCQHLAQEWRAVGNLHIGTMLVLLAEVVAEREAVTAQAACENVVIFGLDANHHPKSGKLVLFDQYVEMPGLSDDAI